MPTAAPTACSHGGCANYAASGSKCREHASSDNQQRGTATARGYDAHWRRLRHLVLLDEPLCASCLSRGRYTPANEVDHIVPIAVAPARRLDRTNLQALCKTCHSRKTMEETHGKRVQ